MKTAVSTLLFSLLVLSALSTVVSAQPSFNTRSIVACDVAEESCGIAVVSFPTGVPAIVAVGEPGIAIANQATPSLATARIIINEINAGMDASAAIDTAVAMDTTAESRQLGVAALHASSPSGVTTANFTGMNPSAETCELTGDTYAVQANLQSSADVCGAMEAAFTAARGSLARRLLASLLAGTRVGTDARGEFSATVKVYSSSWALASFAELGADANVDRSKNWKSDLSHGLNAYLSQLTPGDPRDLVELRRLRAWKIQFIMRRLGFYRGRVNGRWSDESEAALLAMSQRNLFFPKGTEVTDGTRFINAAWSDYIVSGFVRRTLRRPE